MRLTPEVRKFVRFVPLLLLAFATSFAYAKNYNTIVVFGDSLSDTGNVAHLTGEMYRARIPGQAANYTDGRFTDGIDTIPHARNYFGVWVEQFAATLPTRPEIHNSLDGGTDYAYGFATSGTYPGCGFTSGSGTSTGDLGNGLTVEVNNIDKQITDYLNTHPKINDSTLFIVWGGANDFIHAPPQSWGDVAVHASCNMTVNIKRLIDSGATQFIVANLPPMGLTPDVAGLGVEAATYATYESAFFNELLSLGISDLREDYPHRNLTIFELNVFTLFEQIAVSPSSFALTNISTPSRYTGAYPLVDNPDTYLFWDDVHPTTRGHNILADAASSLVAQHQCNAKGQNCVYPVPAQ